MKRKGGSSREGLGRGEENGKGMRKEGRNDNNRKKEKKKPPPPPVIDTVATRTRRQKRDIATKWKQPISILIHIMGYADPETIRMLCCVSKQFCDIIYNNPGMEQNRVIPLLQISPSEEKGDAGRTTRLLRFLQHRRYKLQLYRKIKITDANKFSLSSHTGWMILEMSTHASLADALRLYGIVSLDMSSPPTSPDMGHNYIGRFFSLILPNLRDVNLSNSGFGHSSSLCEFSSNCPNLEKITWHNIDRDQSAIDIDGSGMKHATNLKGIYMDDSVFGLESADQRHQLSDLENDEHSNMFLFCHCRTKLERVSIRNAKWYVDEYVNGVRDDPTLVSQNALIKFVRKAPTSLQWFRSDLSHENMNMLRSERPGIELVN